MFETYYEQFKQHLEIRRYAVGTIQEYLQPLRDFFVFLEESGVKEIQDVTTDLIKDFQVYEYEKLNKCGRPNTAQTQNKYLRSAKLFFKFLREEGVQPNDPARDIHFAREPKNLPKDILVSPEVKKILKAPDTSTILGYRDRAMLEVLYSTGVRASELCRVEIGDVDTSEGYLRVNKGKDGKDRMVPLGKIACRYLENYIQAVRPKLITDPSFRPLFVTLRHQPFIRHVVRQMVKKYAKKAKVSKNVTSHTFRHTCATHMIQNGANIRYVQELLGHESLLTTQIYTHLTINDLKAAHKKCHPREMEARRMAV